MSQTYKSIQIGPIALEGNVLLAPITGVSDMPFRKLVKSFGASLVMSEMIASQAMIRETRQSMKMISKSPEEGPFAVQLAGCDPNVMAEAAKLNEDLGADIIDINMGCPVKKVAIKSFAGSALMRDEALAAKIIQAIVNAVKIPVTLKMRTGWDDQHRNAPTLAKIAEDCGIQMVTVHGRTRCQLYNGRADWQFIRQVKDAVKIPVIGNGDVTQEEEALELLHQSGADGVMIARGAFGRPWFLNQICHFLETGQKISTPSLEEQKQVVLNHYQAILEYHGVEVGIKMARKHLGWYSKGLKNSAEFRVQINQLWDVQEITDAVRHFYDDNIAQAESIQ
ncbi:MAG: tRNA dihydrouridine synthase DusB [Janthinobacterium lividum]